MCFLSFFKLKDQQISRFLNNLIMREEAYLNLFRRNVTKDQKRMYDLV